METPGLDAIKNPALVGAGLRVGSGRNGPHRTFSSTARAERLAAFGYPRAAAAPTLAGLRFRYFAKPRSAAAGAPCHAH